MKCAVAYNRNYDKSTIIVKRSTEKEKEGRKGTAVGVGLDTEVKDIKVLRLAAPERRFNSY